MLQRRRYKVIILELCIFFKKSDWVSKLRSLLALIDDVFLVFMVVPTVLLDWRVFTLGQVECSEEIKLIVRFVDLRKNSIFIGLILEGILSRIVLLTHISKTHRRKLPYRQSLVLGFDSLREGDAIG